MPPFRIFVSSPVFGIEDYRYAVMSAARAAENCGKLEFFFFENSQNDRIAGQTICQSIFARTGTAFDAAFFFFKDRIGVGTREELDYFEAEILPVNPSCQIWWTQIYCETCPPEVSDFLARLQNYNTGLPIVPGEEKIDRPDYLKGRFTAKLFSIVANL